MPKASVSGSAANTLRGAPDPLLGSLQWLDAARDLARQPQIAGLLRERPAGWINDILELGRCSGDELAARVTCVVSAASTSELVAGLGAAAGGDLATRHNLFAAAIVAAAAIGRPEVAAEVTCRAGPLMGFFDERVRDFNRVYGPVVDALVVSRNPRLEEAMAALKQGQAPADFVDKRVMAAAGLSRNVDAAATVIERARARGVGLSAYSAEDEIVVYFGAYLAGAAQGARGSEGVAARALHERTGIVSPALVDTWALSMIERWQGYRALHVAGVVSRVLAAGLWPEEVTAAFACWPRGGGLRAVDDYVDSLDRSASAPVTRAPLVPPLVCPGPDVYQ